ncbi:hypothetical protein Rvan_2785 [Rhodomicrobium vannielii ATCC 17100]|nr:hypothetical protein Rvan_2785 [Rhodomicrobium vannielii ATCC 17100]
MRPRKGRNQLIPVKRSAGGRLRIRSREGGDGRRMDPFEFVRRAGFWYVAWWLDAGSFPGLAAHRGLVPCRSNREGIHADRLKPQQFRHRPKRRSQVQANAAQWQGPDRFSRGYSDFQCMKGDCRLLSARNAAGFCRGLTRDAITRRLYTCDRRRLSRAGGRNSPFGSRNSAYHAGNPKTRYEARSQLPDTL